MEKDDSLQKYGRPPKSICLIDPFENVLNIYRIILEEKGYEVDTAYSLEQALHLCSCRSYSVIITEYFFPLEKMFDFISSIKKTVPETYHILSTSELIEDSNYKAMFDAGLDDFLVKPYGQEILLAHIEKGFLRQEIFIENQKNEKRFYIDSNEQEASQEIFSSFYFKKLLRQEIKKAKRHQEPVSFIFVKLPSEDKMGNQFGPFYIELIKLLRKSLREEDLMGRENGNLGIILEKTDETGSQNLGRRLSTLIHNHPSFQSSHWLHDIIHELSFQYYTFPHQNNIPEFLTPLFKEMGEESLSH
jgi:PleD family two-component response regulator